ncbi:unnamed protein product [Effrenium voratum]|uniref:Uncharacterized protein n=1 Tax=Effrenium voratum TaxID=2562239 RepID=A0AA36NG93_9DINO|nr:unnamed protein product [Effrenium voratum]
MGRKIWLLLLAPSLAWIGLCPRARRPRRQVAVRGATVDVPPPPSQASEGGGGDGYEIRFVDNQEDGMNDQAAVQCHSSSSGKEREVLEQKVLPFRSTQYFTGKSRLCIGAFVGETCQGLGLTEVRMDIQDVIGCVPWSFARLTEPGLGCLFHGQQGLAGSGTCDQTSRPERGRPAHSAGSQAAGR